MNRIHYAFLAGCSALALAGCGADDVVAPNGNIIVNPAPTPTPTPTPTGGSGTVTAAVSCTPGTSDGGTLVLANSKGTVRNCTVPTSITTNLTLSGRRADGIVYTLTGRTEVGRDVDQTNGVAAALTVLPGVTVAGIKDSNLVINRGSKIEADGTAAQPIIFTSRTSLTGVLDQYATNEWGGIIINGRAPVSDCDVAVSSTGAQGGSAGCWRQSEGIVPRPLFGGNVANDDSGTLRYVQVNFTGVTVGIADEIQGITWNGVGSGTTAEYIQIHNSSDDGMEFFGGTVNLKHLVLTGNADDSLDTDNGYRGSIQYVFAARHDANGYRGDSDGSMTMMEIDSSAVNDASPRQFLKVANFTLIQNTPNEPGIKIRGGADVALINGIMLSRAGGTKGCLDIDDAETVQAAGTYGGTPDVGPPILRSVVFDCAVVEDSDGDTFEATTLSNAANNGVNASFVNSLLFLSGASTGNKPANGTNESGVAADAAIKTGTSYGSSFFDQVSYIGAFSGPSDTWTSGWTCNSVIVDLRGATNCTDVRIS